MFQKQKIREMPRLHRATINKAESSGSYFEQDVLGTVYAQVRSHQGLEV